MTAAASPPTTDARTLEETKIIALATGVRIDGDVLRDLGGPRALTIHEYVTTGGITLRLPHAVWVNAPFEEPFCADTPLRLQRDESGLALTLSEQRVPVIEVVPLPGYLDESVGGRPVRDTVMSHADRVRVSPIVGCVYDCDFCDLATVRYRPRPLEVLLPAIDVALEDAVLPPTHLLISGGSPGHTAAQQAYFDETCLAIARHVCARGFDVDVMMTPKPNGPELVERLVDAGVTGFSFNIEVYDETHATAHLPLKRRFAHPHFERTIARAVELLGTGTGRVRSLIIVGLEPAETTLAGVEWLARQGCHPVLSPFRPGRGTKLEGAPPVAASLLRSVLDEAREIVDRHRVALGPRCVPCQHNTLSFPWDVAAVGDA